MVPKLILGSSIRAAAQYVLQPEAHPGSYVGSGAVKRTAEYVLHDQTGDRVAAITTVNLGFDPTDLLDRERANAAWVRMAETAANAETLKAAAGIKPTGRKAEHLVAHLILSWSPDQAEPDHAAMFEAGRAAMAKIGLADRQALMVIHQDRDHAHLHVIASRVSPEDGRLARLSNDRLGLSRWAEAYEREFGGIRCEQRVENNRRRDLGQFVRHRPETDRVREVQEKTRPIEAEAFQAAARALAGPELLAATGSTDAERRLAALGLRLEPAKRGGWTVTDGTYKAKLSAVAAGMTKLERIWKDNFERQADERARPVPRSAQREGGAAEPAHDLARPADQDRTPAARSSDDRSPAASRPGVEPAATGVRTAASEPRPVDPAPGQRAADPAPGTDRQERGRAGSGPGSDDPPPRRPDGGAALPAPAPREPTPPPAVAADRGTGDQSRRQLPDGLARLGLEPDHPRRLELESPGRGLGEPARPEGRLDRTAPEPRTIDQAVAAAGAEVDRRKRADLFDHAATRAEALDAVIAGTKSQALTVARDRQAIEDRKRQAEQAASELRDRLALAYADPAAAEAAWQHLARERGLAGTVAAVARDSGSLGPLKGRRILFSLIANRERADAAASARLVPEAAAKAWNTAIARDLDRAASYRLDLLEAGPEMTRRRQALAERGTEHTARELRDQAAALRRNADLAELHIAIRQARQIAPNPKNPATLAISWAANLAGPELAAVTRLASLYKSACRSAIAAEFRSRDPQAFAAWERANRRSIQHDRGPSLGR